MPNNVYYYLERWHPWDSNGVGQNDKNIRNERVHLTDAKAIINNVFLTLMERGNLCLKKAVTETALLTKKPFSTVWKITQNVYYKYEYIL